MRQMRPFFSRRFRRKSRLLQWLDFFSSVQRVTSTFCALMQLMHIYQLLPYVLSTSFSTHPKRLTWNKKRPTFYIFRHYATYRKLRKKIQEKYSESFFSIFSFLRAFVVSSCRKSGFRVFLSLRYGADLGRSRLVCSSNNISNCFPFWGKMLIRMIGSISNCFKTFVD